MDDVPFDLPFDLKDVRCIVYDKEHPRWGDALKSNVTRTMRAVLENEDPDTLLNGIETDTEYQPIKAETRELRREEQEPTLNVAGMWEITENWKREGFPEPLGPSFTKISTMTLEQDRDLLSGFATTHSSTNRVVGQQLSGFIEGQRVELVATSYQLLDYQLLEASDEPDNPFEWLLESWRGELESETFMRGEVADKFFEGTFVGEKVSLQYPRALNRISENCTYRKLVDNDALKPSHI